MLFEKGINDFDEEPSSHKKSFISIFSKLITQSDISLKTGSGSIGF